MDDLYIRIEWPTIQEFMDFDWFEESCILDNRDEVLSQTYLIPINRYNEAAAELGFKLINIEL